MENNDYVHQLPRPLKEWRKKIEQEFNIPPTSKTGRVIGNAVNTNTMSRIFTIDDKYKKNSFHNVSQDVGKYPTNPLLSLPAIELENMLRKSSSRNADAGHNFSRSNLRLDDGVALDLLYEKNNVLKTTVTRTPFADSNYLRLTDDKVRQEFKLLEKSRHDSIKSLSKQCKPPKPKQIVRVGERPKKLVGREFYHPNFDYVMAEMALSPYNTAPYVDHPMGLIEMSHTVRDFKYHNLDKHLAIDPIRANQTLKHLKVSKTLPINKSGSSKSPSRRRRHHNRDLSSAPAAYHVDYDFSKSRDGGDDSIDRQNLQYIQSGDGGASSNVDVLDIPDYVLGHEREEEVKEHDHHEYHHNRVPTALPIDNQNVVENNEMDKNSSPLVEENLKIHEGLPSSALRAAIGENALSESKPASSDSLNIKEETPGIEHDNDTAAIDQKVEKFRKDQQKKRRERILKRLKRDRGTKLPKEMLEKFRAKFEEIATYKWKYEYAKAGGDATFLGKSSSTPTVGAHSPKAKRLHKSPAADENRQSNSRPQSRVSSSGLSWPFFRSASEEGMLTMDDLLDLPSNSISLDDWYSVLLEDDDDDVSSFFNIDVEDDMGGSADEGVVAKDGDVVGGQGGAGNGVGEGTAVLEGKRPHAKDGKEKSENEFKYAENDLKLFICQILATSHQRILETDKHVRRPVSAGYGGFSPGSRPLSANYHVSPSSNVRQRPRSAGVVGARKWKGDMHG